MDQPKKYSRKEAKKLMKEYGLKWTWDKLLEEGDIQCFCGEWFSNPTHGFVITYGLFENINLTKFVRDPRFPIGRPLYRAPDGWDSPTRWWLKTFFNKEEYEDYIKDKVTFCGPHKTFDEIWENTSYPKSDEEGVNFRNQPVGHTWRSIFADQDGLYGKYKDIIGDDDLKDPKEFKNYEKVISLGFYTTPNPNLMECPICEIVHSIGYWRTCIPFRYKIREKLRYRNRWLYNLLFSVKLKNKYF